MTDSFLNSLIAARLEGSPVPSFDESELPDGLSSGYQLQAQLNRRLNGLGLGPIAGYKIGCTTPVMQNYLGIPHPCSGEVFASRTYSSDVSLKHRDFIRPGVECEIAVILGADMLGCEERYDKNNTGDYVKSCHAAIEVVDDRYHDYQSLGVAALIADDFFNAAEVLGAGIEDWRELNLAAIEGKMRINGVSVGQGTGDMILGHPLTALAWLANEMIDRGSLLKAGSFVSLGSVVKTVWIDQPGSVVEVKFDSLGSAVVTFE